jgi:hypothetical protein
VDVVQLERHAEHCLQQAAQANDPFTKSRFLKAARAWQSLAKSKREVDGAFISDALGESAERSGAA